MVVVLLQTKGNPLGKIRVARIQRPRNIQYRNDTENGTENGTSCYRPVLCIVVPLTFDGGAFRIERVVDQFLYDAAQIRDRLLGRDSPHGIVVEPLDFRSLRQLLLVMVLPWIWSLRHKTTRTVAAAVVSLLFGLHHCSGGASKRGITGNCEFERYAKCCQHTSTEWRSAERNGACVAPESMILIEGLRKCDEC